MLLGMDYHARLRFLEAQRRDLIGMAIVAKAHYLALNDELSSTPAAIERARLEWQNLEAKKLGIAYEISTLHHLTEESA